VRTYQWRIKSTTGGQVTLTAHGILVGVFAFEGEAEEYIVHIVKRDTVERRARRWAERELNQWADRWSEEFGLPREEVLEDIRAGIASMLIDLTPTITKGES
jgi:hypothetical protein